MRHQSAFSLGNYGLMVMLLSLCQLLLTSCSSGGGSETAVDPFPSEIKSAVLGPAGGTITHMLADGTAFAVDVPAGALTEQTTLTLATQRPAAGQRFNLLLQPAGLVLASGATATLTITLPPGNGLPADGALVYDSALVPFTRLPDGRLQMVLSSFAGMAATAGSGAPKVRQKISMAASTGTCGSVPYMETNEGLSAVDAVDIELYGQCMIAAVQALAQNEQFAEAVQVAGSVAAYLQKTGAGGADTLVIQAQDIACTAYGLALDRANTTSVTTMGTLYNLVKPVLFWETTVQQLGASCPAIPADSYQTIINAKTGEAIAYYDQQKANITTTSSANYADARAEAAASAQAENEVLALNPPTAVRQTVTAEISQRAQPGLLDAMLQAPWDQCRNTAKYDELIYLMETLGQTDSVKSAAQYCGTILNVQARDSQGTITAQLAQPLGGVSAAANRTSDSLNVDKTSILVLNGPIQALQCPADQAGGSETLTIALDGTTISTYSSPPYLNNQLAIDLATALEAAHPGATGSLTSASLTVTRDGAPCNGYWGANPAPLLTLNLSLLTPSMSGIVTAVNGYGQPTQLRAGCMELGQNDALLPADKAPPVTLNTSFASGNCSASAVLSITEPASNVIGIDVQSTLVDAAFTNVDVIVALTFQGSGTLSLNTEGSGSSFHVPDFNTNTETSYYADATMPVVAGTTFLVKIHQGSVLALNGRIATLSFTPL